MRLQPGRLVFIDETGGHNQADAPKRPSHRGERPPEDAFGHWVAQIFIAGLHAPADRAVDRAERHGRAAFDAYIDTQLAPQRGDVVILDNLPVRKSARAAIGDICDLFDPQECWHFFKAAVYAPN